MSTKIIARIFFITWAVAIATLSIISYSNINDALESVRLTSSGLIMHIIAYFIGALLCSYSFRVNGIVYLLLSCFSIFLYSVVLEIVQFYLPYRTFNPRDIAANAFGIILFVLIWTIYSHFLKRKQPADNGDLPRYKKSEYL